MRGATPNNAKSLYIPALFLIILGLSAQGCVLAVVPLIYAVMGDEATATVEIPRPVDEVYKAGLDIARNDKNLVVEKIDPAERTVWIKKGTQTAVVKVVPIDAGKTQLIFTVDSGVNQEEDKRLALRGAGRVCDALGVKYTVVE
jgi:uncharacterized protein (DUF697 family)